MSTVCGGCGNSIKDLFFMECSKCSKLFDLLCLNISKDSFNALTEDFKASWLCPSCTCSLPKSNNSSTPVRPSAPSATLNDTYTKNINYVNTKRGSQPQTAMPGESTDRDFLRKNDVSMLLEEIRSLRQEILELHQQNRPLKPQLSSYQLVLNNTLIDHSKKLEAADLKIMDLRTTVDYICQLSSSHEQELLRNELEIVGVPEINSENVGHISMVAVKKLGIDLAEEDIDDVRRVGPRPQKSSQAPNIMPRPIVLKLLRRRKRDEILSAAKSRRNMTTEGIVGVDPCKIYFNERLTKRNRQLFRAARDRARSTGYRYCWVQNGTIFIRRSDGKPATRILSTHDLDRLDCDSSANKVVENTCQNEAI